MLANKSNTRRVLCQNTIGVIALFTIIRTDRNMLLACYSHKHISYRIRTIIRKAILCGFYIFALPKSYGLLFTWRRLCYADNQRNRSV
ncbi:hypothetical protein [Wolbachia endosymbiont (group A) of Scambus nigricans]|uniref:hypothetical protein n=1 Tax=Wolbachia endosymbiont (group A) of Scambus nigricans TaxID=2954055 RepID=UPI002232B45C|nr:hypothetical protein [Wolbachia endosymbiont (group A) of Scambus nigricans]